jgi:beta-glucanase (GH16 family)
MKNIILWLLTPVVGALVVLGFLSPDQDDGTSKKRIEPPTASRSVYDPLSTYDTTRWMKADDWKNGAPFDNGWRAENIEFADGQMTIRLDDVSFLNEPYSSGQYQTLGFYGYGCYEASFRPVAASGVVSSFFIFAGPHDNGGNGQHNEIDVEFLGKDTERVQLNFWTNDDDYLNGHERMVDLGFDAADAFHRYGFKWTAEGISWFVDGEPVHFVDDAETDPTPKADESLQKIMMNVWPVDETAADWAGMFYYPDAPLYGHYEWVRHIAGDDCDLAAPPDLPSQTDRPRP